ncbi:hypothetical protein [Sinomonas humi]|uniref:Polymerase nucleotidyl transferase domain-containing protein n=1 Tax=Sinomonas humi TaxID=1338436 RepID=A0A0B2AL97_9MICC|nr:hypothetical protein [Sinomonas humi]KHL04101.1 hypothetical protein LK10_06985 [Sinomonas humi]
MKRQRATELIHQVLARANHGEWPASLVTEIRIFGSYMRGALEPGDVDLAYVMEGRGDKRWEQHFLDSIFRGGDSQAIVRKSLRGSSRSVSLTLFEEGSYDEVPMMVLWRRGEPLELATARLESIEPDPAAGKAPRTAMTAAFEGLDKHLALFIREELLELEAAGAIRMRQIELHDEDEADLELDPDARYLQLEQRWGPESPLRRAAAAALRHVQEQRGSLGPVDLHGRRMDRSTEGSVFVDLKLRYFDSLLGCIGGDCEEWIEVVHPTRKGRLLALVIEPGDRAAQESWQAKSAWDRFFR